MEWIIFTVQQQLIGQGHDRNFRLSVIWLYQSLPGFTNVFDDKQCFAISMFSKHHSSRIRFFSIFVILETAFEFVLVKWVIIALLSQDSHVAVVLYLTTFKVEHHSLIAIKAHVELPKMNDVFEVVFRFSS